MNKFRKHLRPAGTLAALVWMFMSAAFDAAARTAQPIEDWFDADMPLFAADAMMDQRREYAYVVDQVSARVFRIPLNASGAAAQAAPIRSDAGFKMSREDVLALVARRADFSAFLEGRIKLVGSDGRIRLFDARKIFGSGRWVDVLTGEAPVGEPPADPAPAPAPAPDHSREQALLAEAVAELAGNGIRARPWGWSLRGDDLSLIDSRGRTFIFHREKSAGNRDRLKLIFQLDSVYSRLTHFDEASMTAAPGDILEAQAGDNAWRAYIADDPYTGERALAVESFRRRDSRPGSASAAKKRKIILPHQWTDFLRQPALLADGPAGQLITAKIRLTQLGLKTLLILSDGGRVRIIPWGDDQDPRPEDVVVMPEGFAVPEPPAWRLIGWNREFSGSVSFGNSRYQRLLPILSEREAELDPAALAPAPKSPDTVAMTAGLFILDADRSEIVEWPAIEWPRLPAANKILMTAEPLDLIASRTGDVLILARDAERGLRLFKMTDVIQPVLDLPDHLSPQFLTATAPMLMSKSDKRKTTWLIAGQPLGLVRNESFDVNWNPGQSIAWRDESAGYTLFNTDPGGQSDTGLTIPVEGIGDVRRAALQKSRVWILETDSGILRLDASDPTSPEIDPIDPRGADLRQSMFGPIYTVPAAGSAEVFVVGPAGNKNSVGRFIESWTALALTLDKIYFKDNASGQFYSVSRRSAGSTDDVSQVTGRLEFDYADPGDILLCAMGDESYCMLVRPKAPTFLLGPMPYGTYLLDASAGGFDIAPAMVFAVNRPEVFLPDVKLTKSLDFLYRRAVAYEESDNPDMARFNYDMYLSLSPGSPSADVARSGLLILLARDAKWDAMIDFYRKAPPGARWTADAARLVFDHLPNGAERIDAARLLLKLSPRAGVQRMELLFFLYAATLDPAIRAAAAAPGMPGVYARFFDAFDRIRK